MFGNWRWNLGFGIFGALLIFFVGLSNNPVLTSLLRGVYGFITLFLVAYPIRFIIGTFVVSKSALSDVSEGENHQTGLKVDISTPDEGDELNEALKSQLASSNPGSAKREAEEDNLKNEFQPLKPTQLFSAEKVQPKEMTNAIRHLTGE